VEVPEQLAESRRRRHASARKDLNARLRVEGDPEGVPFDPHPSLLRTMTTMTLITRFGPLDLCFAPAGFADRPVPPWQGLGGD
jgi:hypothetical protein